MRYIDCVYAKREKQRERNINEWGSLFPISGTKATSVVSESRGIAPFGQLAREQQAARASDHRPRHTSPLPLVRHEWDNESVRLHANDSGVVLVTSVTMPFVAVSRR